MRIDVHEPVAAGRRAAKHARKQAVKTVDAARAVDLHVPAEAARTVAKRAAKRTAKQARVAADRAARRQTKHRSKHGLRLIVAAVATGAAVALAVSLARRIRAESPLPPADSAPALDLDMAEERDALDGTR